MLTQAGRSSTTGMRGFWGRNFIQWAVLKTVGAREEVVCAGAIGFPKCKGS